MNRKFVRNSFPGGPLTISRGCSRNKLIVFSSLPRGRAAGWSAAKRNSVTTMLQHSHCCTISPRPHAELRNYSFNCGKINRRYLPIIKMFKHVAPKTFASNQRLRIASTSKMQTKRFGRRRRRRLGLLLDTLRLTTETNEISRVQIKTFVWIVKAGAAERVRGRTEEERKRMNGNCSDLFRPFLASALLHLKLELRSRRPKLNDRKMGHREIGENEHKLLHSIERLKLISMMEACLGRTGRNEARADEFLGQ